MPLLVLIVLGAMAIASGAVAISTASGEIADALDAVAREAVESAGFSGSILVYKGGQVVLSRGYGMADRDRQLAVTPETVFDIGSLMKHFTRSVVVELIDEGLIDLDDTLAQYLDGVPQDKRAITIRQTLDHQGGFPEYILSHEQERARGDIHFADHGRISKSDSLALIFARDLDYAPGTSRQYSNAGYTVLAALVEAVEGKPFPTILRERMIEPAGLVNTGLYGAGIWTDGQGAVGYDDVVLASNDPTKWPEISWMLMGAGGLVSNPDDMFRWIQAAQSGRILGGPIGRETAARLTSGGFAGGNHYGFIAYMVPIDADTGVLIASNSQNGVRDLVGKLLAAVREASAVETGEVVPEPGLRWPQ